MKNEKHINRRGVRVSREGYLQIKNFKNAKFN
jgi:hypothetical protein